MKTLLKWLGIAATVLVCLVILGAAVVYAASNKQINRNYRQVGTSWVRPVADSALIARGRHLGQAVAKCVDCHGENLGGTPFIADAAFANFPAPNITGGRGGVVSGYSDEELARLIQHGVKRDGRPAFIMPAESFRHMSDYDLAAVIAWLRSVPPVDSAWHAPKVGPVGRVLLATGQFPAFPAAFIDHEMRDVLPAPEPDTSVAYGRYLVQVGSCPVCHNPVMSGGEMPGPPGPIPGNLTPAGIGDWTEADFVRVLREGKGIGGREIDNMHMPWRNAGRMSDEEIHAVWLYLRSLPPKELGER